MRKDDFDDLDDMIAELEDSLGVNTSEYLDDYLDTVGLDEDESEGEVGELGEEFEDDFDLDGFEALDEDFDTPEEEDIAHEDFDDFDDSNLDD